MNDLTEESILRLAQQIRQGGQSFGLQGRIVAIVPPLESVKDDPEMLQGIVEHLEARGADASVYRNRLAALKEP